MKIQEIDNSSSEADLKQNEMFNLKKSIYSRGMSWKVDTPAKVFTSGSILNSDFISQDRKYNKVD